jgi:hypothetical protein
LDPRVLALNTLHSLFKEIYGYSVTKEIFSYFPYRAEVTTLRADLALKSFDKEMGTNDDYFIIKEGFSELIKRMAKDVCTILPNHKLIDLETLPGRTHCKFSNGKVLSARQVVLALHRDAIAELKPFRSWDILNHLKMQPLLRVYAKFANNWFSHLKRIVTPQRLRYILPLKDSIMISYTDAEDTEENKAVYSSFMSYSKVETNNDFTLAIKKLLENIGVDRIYNTPIAIKISFFLFLINPISITIMTSMIGRTNVGSILCK